MPRIRYLKPDFFFDEDIAQLSYQVRLAFQGLWCHSDKEGRLEDQPRRLKALIFPYDKVDMDNLLEKLTEKPFIKRYKSNNRNYIQIINWHKHQKPHHTEKDSTFPEPLDNGEVTVREQEGMGKGMEKGMGKNKSLYVDFEKSTIGYWNSFCDKYPILSKVKEISGKRRDKLKKRYEVISFRDFNAILTEIKDQPFCLGASDKGWKVSFDWLIENDTNYLKVLEGRYKDSKATSKYKPVDKDCKNCNGTGFVYNQSKSGNEVCPCRVKNETK